MNKNKGELELKVKAKGVGDKFQAMLGSVQNRNELKRKVEDLVAKAVSDKTEMTLNKEGKLTLTTKIPSLENYNFNLEVGLDPQTLLPYAGARVDPPLSRQGHKPLFKRLLTQIDTYPVQP